MILLLGPYFGSFEYEVTTFRPYITWITRALKSEKVYVSTHFNRQFMYRNITDNFLPIYKNLSRDETLQSGYIHDEVSLKAFNIFSKMLKDFISKKENVQKKYIETKNIGYTKSAQYYPLHQRVFEKISIESINISDEMKDKILFIPYGKDDVISYIYNNLKEILTVVGNTECSLCEDNTVLKRADYIANGLECIVGMITYAKAVVCPVSYWTLLCNLQNVPVFSWGDNPDLYRFGGVYNRTNQKAVVLPQVEKETLLKSLVNFINNHVKGKKL